MAQIEHLQISLWEALKEATIAPEEADLKQLLATLDQALLQLDTVGQLQVAAEAIVQIVQVFQYRSTLAFEELEASNRDADPIMPTDAFNRYVRQSMEVDFEQFIEPLDRLPRKVSERQPIDGSSVVGELDKTALLQALDEQMRQEPELTEAEIFNRTIAIAHDENVSEWVATIGNWIEEQSVPEIPLLQLQQAIAMPLVQLWLALLLGGYAIEQRGEFYEREQIWVLGRC